ncbi:MAG: DNA topoisomerase I [Candidatus Heimdallarchaeaceae archaeon]
MSSIETPYVLGIAEKPQAARRLAYALDENNKPTVKKLRNISVFVCTRDNIRIVIAPAVGHLFTLSSIGKTWNYPVLDYEWVPSHTVSKSARTKNFVDVFKSLAKGANNVIIMTDFDREGEVIGYLILKYLVGRTDAERMKFSTLTVRDILQAYDQREKSLDLGYLNSGLIRHYVDWLYGINYSRALSLAVKKVSGQFKTISIGRVQGPTLGTVVELESKIKMFLPIPFWTIESEVILDKKKFKAFYERSKIGVQKEAVQIIKDCSGLAGKITDITSETSYQYPFPPFDLGSLQREAYRYFKFSPSKTLEYAENLYLKALISYPRTDSQKLPMTLGHKTILSKLSTQSDYSTFANEIISRKKFKPKEGRRIDAAHPAIHPTGNVPDNSLSTSEGKIYDLVVKRYLSVFGTRAEILKGTIVISVKTHKFEVRGSKIIDEGWIKYYKPYFSLSEQILPDVQLNSDVKFSYINSKEDFTSPPLRFNESSLLKNMETEKIGTKATRAGIIKTLFDRGYVEGKVISPTPLGVGVVDVLQNQYPILVKSEMTRNLEDIMEDVQNKKKTIDSTIFTIKNELKDLLILFHKKEEEIGQSLYENLRLSEKSELVVLGKCLKCRKGDLRIIKSRKSGKRFISCSAYFDKSVKCTATFPLPNTGAVRPTSKKCPHDGLPIIEWQRGKRKYQMCISPDCPSKKEGDKN